MAEVFTIPPAAPRSLLVLGTFVVLLLAILLVLGYFAFSSQATRYEMSPTGLAIRGTMYGRTIPWSSLRLEEARPVDLAYVPDLQPTMRTNGVGLPGYRAGWFRLRRSGRALIFLTDPSRVVVVPTSDGYTLLLSVPDPDAFIAALHRHGAEDRAGA